MKKTIKLVCLFLTAAALTAGCGGKGPSKNEYRLEGIQKLEAGDYAGAVESFDQAVAKSRGTVGGFELDVLKYRAEAEYRLEDYAAAAHTYDVLLQVDEKRAEYRYMRCMANAKAGNVESALADYTEQTAADKESSELSDAALLILGTALEEQGENDKAITLYQQAMDQGQANAELYNRMGVCKLNEKAYDEALQYFEQGIQTGDEAVLPSLKFNRAVTYEYQGDFERALKELEAYAAEYGGSEEADREIAFLRTR